MKIIAQSDVITLARIDDGLGILSVVPQYYLSTSETETINGVWSYKQPVWSSGHYIWTRSEITNSENEVTYTTPIVATALNSANKAANDASTKADSAYDTAESASDTANTASTTAAEAKTIASTANETSAQANTKAEKAQSDATQAIKTSNDAKDGVTAVNQDISSLKTTVDGMNTDISTAQQNITKNANAITGINQKLSTDYATKTEVSDTKANLETEISTSASNLAASVKETYASKSDVSTIQGELENKIQVNTDGLSATSKKVTSLESQTGTISQNLTNAAKTAEDAKKNAQTAIANAKAAQDTADTAVSNAKEAGDKATEAQNQLNAAKKNVADADAALKTAKTNYDAALSAYNSVSADPEATAVQIEAAKEKLDQAQTALNKALADVLTANHDVSDAQTAAQDALNNAVTAYQNAETAMKDAKTAQDTADKAVASAKKANEDLAALTSKVTEQGTKIEQNSESITSLASRTTTVENKFTGYYTKTEADSAIKQKADSITSSVSQTYETKTDSASKLSSAKSYADSSSSQALKDAKTDTDNKLKNYSTTTQMNSAIKQKADSITSSVSQTYETKTDSASNLATAKSYADSKASSAQSGAQTYTDNKLKNYSTTSQMTSAIQQKADSITSEVKKVDQKIDDLQVGGRNLLTNSEREVSGGYPSSGYSNYLEWKVILPTGATHFVLSFEAKSTVAGDKVTSYFYNPSNVTKAEGSDNGSNNRSDGGYHTTLTTEWKRYWVKWTAPIADTRNVLPFRVFNGYGTGTISMRKVKFEVGTTPTDWTPAPEDLTSYTDSQINQKADSITSEVKKVDQKIDDLQVGGRNLWMNSSLSENLNDQDTHGHTVFHEFTIEDGFKCLHVVGEATNNSFEFNSKPMPIANKGDVFTLFADFKFKNIAKGPSTNDLPLYAFSIGGERQNGKFIGPTILKQYNIQSGGYTYFPITGGDQDWKRIGFTFRYDYTPSTKKSNVLLYFRNFTGDVYVKNVKLERGNKPTDWTPAPEDVTTYTDSKIKQTSDSITQQISSVNNGKNMVQQINLNSGGLKINVDKLEIGSAINSLVSDSVNEYAINTSSSTAPTSGWSTTQPTWSDGKYIWMHTKTTKKDGTVSYSNPACITGAKGATGPQGESGIDLSNGKMLFTDPYFSHSLNNCAVYNQHKNGNVKIEHVAISSDNPFSTTNYTFKEMKVTNTGTANPGCGGFVWGHQSRANAIFIYRIIAKIPADHRLWWASNATGSGSSAKWLTSNAGTGRFTEYLFKLTCGATGNFSTTGYFYLDGAVGTTDNPVEWRVAYATCFDMTNKSDISIVQSLASEAYLNKNKVVYSENADPSSTNGYMKGDTWFNKATGGIWQFDGKAWNPHQVGTVSISDGAVTADKINVTALSAISANMGTVTAGVIKSSDDGKTFTMDVTNKKLNWSLPQTKMSDTGEITTTKQAVEPYGASSTANYTYETFMNSDGVNASKKADLSETNYLHEIADLTGDGLAMLSSQRSTNSAEVVSHGATGVNHGSIILSSYLSQADDDTKISNYKTTTMTSENISTTRIDASDSIKCRGNEVLTTANDNVVVFTKDFNSRFNNEFANSVESYQCIRRSQTGWSTHVVSARGAMHHIVALDSMLYIVWLASTAAISVTRLHDGKGGSGQWNASIDSARFHRLDNNYIEVFNNENASITIFS